MHLLLFTSTGQRQADPFADGVSRRNEAVRCKLQQCKLALLLLLLHDVYLVICCSSITSIW